MILISGVPSSVSYAEFARQLREAMPAGLRVIGPNCMGVFHAATRGARGVNTLFLNEKRLEVRSSEHLEHRPPHPERRPRGHGPRQAAQLPALPGRGELRQQVRREGERPARLVRARPRRRADRPVPRGAGPRRGPAAVRPGAASRTPIVAYKAGRTEAGARSAASHTASLSGNYEVFRAACGQSGVILAETIEDWYDLVRTFSLLAGRPPAGNRVAGVVNAGFESTVGADELKGLTQARLGPGTVERLNAINRHGPRGHSLALPRPDPHGRRRHLRRVRRGGHRRRGRGLRVRGRGAARGVPQDGARDLPGPRQPGEPAGRDLAPHAASPWSSR